LGLDKWIKPDDKKEAKKKVEENREKQVKKSSQVSTTREEPEQKQKKVDSSRIPIKKHHLKCLKKGCNYQKTIVKKHLNEKDAICPRCKSKMKSK